VKQFFEPEDIAALAAPLKFAFVSAMNEEGYPHFNLILSLEANGDHEVMFARSYSGQTKRLLEKNGKGAFFSLGLDMKYYYGKMTFLRIDEGELKAYYNSKPSARYSAYIGIDKAYVCSLDGFEGPTQLDPNAVGARVMGFLEKLPALAANTEGDPLSGYTAELMNRQPSGKILAWEDTDGLPRLAPLFEALPAGTGRMAFPIADEQIAAIPDGAKVGLHCMQLTTMQGLQVRGIFHKSEGDTVGTIDVVQLYDPMLFHPQVYFPMTPYASVREF